MAQVQTLIDVATLAARLADRPDGQGLRIFDCRASLLDPTAGASLFSLGHIAGAQYADLNSDLSAAVIPGKTGRHPLPSTAAFIAQVQQWGINNNDLVVAYDADTGAYAARLWWMMRWLGHASVVVLDGGLQAWTAAGQPLTQITQRAPASRFEVRPPLTRQVGAADLLAPATRKDPVAAPGILLDARDLARFKGEAEPIDPVAGHIPGAVCAPFSANLATDGRFKNAPELAARFEQLGVSADTPTTCYCGSGVTATHNILALVHAGFAEPALYPGSWSEWITDPGRPIATA